MFIFCSYHTYDFTIIRMIRVNLTILRTLGDFVDLDINVIKIRLTYRLSYFMYLKARKLAVI